MKKEQGITLISLVVTIIILIILAGISVNLILGQDGIINKAKEAKQNMEYAQIEEQEQLNQLYDQMIGESNGSTSYDAIAKLTEFKKEIASAITDMGIATSENADATTMANNIKSLSGESSADKVSYDNTNSGLTSTNVQGAVDELNDSLNNLNISKWTVVATYTGKFTHAIDLSEYNEVAVASYKNIVIVPVALLTASNKQFGVGFYKAPTDYCGTTINFSLSKIYTDDYAVYVNGSNTTTSTEFTIMVR